MGPSPWANFWLNPRRLRGSDFLMRWSQGAWSEERLSQAVHSTGQYFALPYGPSGTAPDNDVRAFELYFERLEKAGLSRMKRPDLLIFRAQDRDEINKVVDGLHGIPELPFTPENHPSMQILLSKAILAVECENSLWRAKQMPDYHTPLTPQKRLGGRLGLKKTAVLPTIIIKEEDRKPLKSWQRKHKIPIHIWHAFLMRLSALLWRGPNDSSLVEISRQRNRYFKPRVARRLKRSFIKSIITTPILWRRQSPSPH